MGQFRKRIQAFFIMGMPVLLVVSNVVLTYQVFTAPFPGHNDFFSRWEGARAFFMDGLSPYSEETSLNIQNRIYGRPVLEDEDPGFFVYPFYTVFVVGPTVWLDYAWAAALWMVFLEICLIAALFLILRLYQWNPPPLLLVLLLLWALLDYFPARGLFLGQPSHVVYVLQVLVLWALLRPNRDYDQLAGLALALSTFKPQMGYLLVPFLLLWGVSTRRWRFVGAFTLGFSGLMLASFALQPDWFGDWVAQVRLYPQYTIAAYPDTGSPVWIVTQYYLNLGNLGEWALNLVFILPMLWAWYGALVQRRPQRFLWAALLTLTVTHLVALRTATPHFVVFNLVMLFYFKALAQKWGNLPVGGLILGLWFFSWTQFLLTVQGRASLEHPSLFLPMPFVIFMLLWFTRRMWWAQSPMPAPSSALALTITSPQQALSHDPH